MRISESGRHRGVGDFGEDLVGGGGAQREIALRLRFGIAGEDQADGAALGKQGQHPPGQFRATGCQTQPDAGLSGIEQAAEIGQGLSTVAAEFQVQNADAAGAGHRHGDAGMGGIRGGQAEDVKCFLVAHAASPSVPPHLNRRTA